MEDMNKHTREALLHMENNEELYNYVKTVRSTSSFTVIQGIKFFLESKKVTTPDWFDFGKASYDDIVAKIIEIQKEKEVV